MTILIAEYNHLQEQILNHASLAASAPYGHFNVLTCLSPDPLQQWQAHVMQLHSDNHFSIVASVNDGSSELIAMRHLLADIQRHNARVLGEVSVGTVFQTEQRDGSTWLHSRGQASEHEPEPVNEPAANEAATTPHRHGVRQSIRRMFRRHRADGNAPDIARESTSCNTPVNRTASRNTTTSDTTTDQSSTSGSDHSISDSSYITEPGANVYSYGKWRLERQLRMLEEQRRQPADMQFGSLDEEERGF
ncbi:hypothetical protein HBI64_234450 [Parastagonospora nodorum]|nr:hypothetical protein HBI64_234450 [Parastagonospora nodorum]